MRPGAPLHSIINNCLKTKPYDTSRHPASTVRRRTLNTRVEAFRPFTLAHYCALLCIAALIVLAVAAGRGQRDARAPTRLERTLAYANLAVWIAAHGWWQLPARFDPAITLPLQMCHITSLVASAVLLTRNDTLRAVLYFWAFALCTQAMITPSLIDPPSSHVFWSFWFLHGFVMMIAIYDLTVYGFRPRWRDYRAACVAAAAYVAVVLPVNLALGANYGFVGKSKPLNPSIVDHLGPWPERLLIIVPLAALAMLLALLPWLAWQARASRPARR
jgi:hypothetical integral membrane protein (TIGR02206 family)